MKKSTVCLSVGEQDHRFNGVETEPYVYDVGTVLYILTGQEQYRIFEVCDKIIYAYQCGNRTIGLQVWEMKTNKVRLHCISRLMIPIQLCSLHSHSPCIYMHETH